MNKKSMMKSLSLAAIALMTITSCSHDAWNQTYNPSEQTAYEFKSNFKNVVMGGNDIDANQTWSTAVTASVNVSVDLNYGEDYKVYVFTADPCLNKDAKYIGVTTVKSGSSANLTISKPTDVSAVYIACQNKKGNFFVQRVEMEGTTASVNFGGQAGAAKAPTRSSTFNTNTGSYSTNPNDYIVSDRSYWKEDILNYNNDYEGYYDLSTVPAEHLTYLDFGINNDLGLGNNNPVYGDGMHFIVPAGKTVHTNGINWHGYNADNRDRIIVVKGTLIIDGDESNGQTWFKLDCGKSILVEAGGTLKINATTFEVSNTSTIYNYGTIEMNNTYLNYGNSFRKGFYNGGTIKEANESSQSAINIAGQVDNQSYTYYNDGNIEIHSFQFNANARLINVGHIKADTGKKGATQMTDLSASAQNGTVINICDMSVKLYGVHDYVGCDGSLLYCEDGLMTNASANVMLGKQAQIECGNFYSNGASFYASNNFDEYAILKVNNTLTEVNGGTGVTNGYVYMDINEISSRDGNWHKEQFLSKKLLYSVSEETAPEEITIPAEEDGCNYIGFNEGGGGDFTPSYVYFAFEDLGMGDDFDFNDVVVRIGIPNEAGVAQVELCATGGTLETYVYNGATQIGEEVHAEFGWEYGTTYVDDKGNTNKKDQLVTPIKVIGEVTVPEGTSVADLDINIHVTNKGVENVVTRPKTGETPFCVVVSGDDEGKWFWPIERHNISDAYPEFGKWGANWESNPDWYKNPKLDEVVKW